MYFSEIKRGVLDMRKGEVKGRVLFSNIEDVKKSYDELFAEFINSLRIKGRAEQTIKSYYHHNNYFKRFLKEKNLKYCNEISGKTLEEYILYLREEKHMTNGISINSYIRNVSPILKFGVKRRYIAEDFIAPVVQEEKKIKEIYTPEELHDLLEKPKKRDFTAIRTWAIIWTLASTAIRARELRELKIKNVNLLDRTIAVQKTKNKKARYVPISMSFAPVLEEYLTIRKGNQDDYLFCNVYNTELAMSTLQTSVKKYCNSRGIGKCSLHLFRHTFITNAVNKNVSPLILQRITGHSTMKELSRYYNNKTTDLIDVIDEVAPQTSKKENYFKKRN